MEDVKILDKWTNVDGVLLSEDQVVILTGRKSEEIMDYESRNVNYETVELGENAQRLVIAERPKKASVVRQNVPFSHQERRIVDTGNMYAVRFLRGGREYFVAGNSENVLEKAGREIRLAESPQERIKERP